MLVERLTALHSSDLKNSCINLDNLQIKRVDVYGVETPYASYMCCRVDPESGEQHGIFWKRVNTLLSPNSLRCRRCNYKTTMMRTDLELREYLGTLMKKKWPAHRCSTVDLTNLKQYFDNGDCTNQPGYFVTFSCLRLDLSGKVHGEQRVRKSDALSLRFFCQKCATQKVAPITTDQALAFRSAFGDGGIPQAATSKRKPKLRLDIESLQSEMQASSVADMAAILGKYSAAFSMPVQQTSPARLNVANSTLSRTPTYAAFPPKPFLADMDEVGIEEDLHCYETMDSLHSLPDLPRVPSVSLELPPPELSPLKVLALTPSGCDTRMLASSHTSPRSDLPIDSLLDFPLADVERDQFWHFLREGDTDMW